MKKSSEEVKPRLEKPLTNDPPKLSEQPMSRDKDQVSVKSQEEKEEKRYLVSNDTNQNKIKPMLQEDKPNRNKVVLGDKPSINQTTNPSELGPPKTHALTQDKPYTPTPKTNSLEHRFSHTNPSELGPPKTHALTQDKPYTPTPKTNSLEHRFSHTNPSELGPPKTHALTQDKPYALTPKTNSLEHRFSQALNPSTGIDRNISREGSFFSSQSTQKTSYDSLVSQTKIGQLGGSFDFKSAEKWTSLQAKGESNLFSKQSTHKTSYDSLVSQTKIGQFGGSFDFKSGGNETSLQAKGESNLFSKQSTHKTSYDSLVSKTKIGQLDDSFDFKSGGNETSLQAKRESNLFSEKSTHKTPYDSLVSKTKMGEVSSSLDFKSGGKGFSLQAKIETTLFSRQWARKTSYGNFSLGAKIGQSGGSFDLFFSSDLKQRLGFGLEAEGHANLFKLSFAYEMPGKQCFYGMGIDGEIEGSFRVGLSKKIGGSININPFINDFCFDGNKIGLPFEVCWKNDLKFQWNDPSCQFNSNSEGLPSNYRPEIPGELNLNLNNPPKNFPETSRSIENNHERLSEKNTEARSRPQLKPSPVENKLSQNPRRFFQAPKRSMPFSLREPFKPPLDKNPLQSQAVSEKTSGLQNRSSFFQAPKNLTPFSLEKPLAPKNPQANSVPVPSKKDPLLQVPKDKPQQPEQIPFSNN